MEIYLDRRAMRQIQLAVEDALEDGDSESLRDEIAAAFRPSDVDEIERRVDSGDFLDFLSEILDEWGGEDLDELLELLESQLSDADMDLRYAVPAGDEGDDEDEDDDEDDDDSDDDGDDEEELDFDDD